MICAHSAWAMTMADPCAKLLSVRAADGGARLLLALEISEEGILKKETLSVFAARFSRLPDLGELDEETLSYLRREAALCEALGMGLRSLAACGGSKTRLQQKLRARGVRADIAGEAVAELALRGYLDEERSAMREIDRALAKLWGDRRILADLRSKGYDEEALRPVLERLAKENGAARCRVLLEKRYAEQMRDPTQVSKVIAALMRYGYTQSEIRAALQYK